MSYCRWSSDEYRSDVYCYANVSGYWTTHVAGNRHVGEAPPVPRIGSVPNDEWLAAHKAHMAWLKTCDRRPIGLPHDGASFDDAGPGEMADRLVMLRDLGYHVPEYAIEALREEAATPELQNNQSWGNSTMNEQKIAPTKAFTKEEAEAIRRNILAVGDAAKKLLNSGLSRRAIAVLLNDATGLAKKDILAVLDAARDLPKLYTVTPT